MKVEIYSDIACPWCYIGKKRFDRALSAFPQSDEIEVVFRPYQLDPSLPDTPHPLKEQLREKFGPGLDSVLEHTTSAAKQEGLDFRFHKVKSVNTLAAHRLLHLAKQESSPAAQRALAEKIFEAYFTNGANVADPDLLASLAAEMGLDAERVRTYLNSDEGQDDVLYAIDQAQQIGIRAVPTFVFNGRQAVQGAQPTSALLKVFEELQAQVDSQGENTCVDGTCS